MKPDSILLAINHNYQGRSQAFSKGGGYTVSKQGLFNYGQDIVMAFSPPVVGCLVKKKLATGGVTDTPGPPLATPLITMTLS